MRSAGGPSLNGPPSLLTHAVLDDTHRVAHQGSSQIGIDAFSSHVMYKIGSQ